MDAKLKSLMIEGIDKIDPLLNDEKTVKILEKLFDEITLFNPSFKLVAADGEDLVVKHILDCLAPFPIIKNYVNSDSVFADLGSGSGLPGLVLASAFENSFSLVERMGRRAGFLRNTITLTGLNDRIRVVESDLSQVKETFDIVTFRAFRQMKDISRDLQRITKSGSTIIIYKSSDENINEDLQCVDLNVFTYNIVSYQVPFLDAQRSLLVLKKI